MPHSNWTIPELNVVIFTGTSHVSLSWATPSLPKLLSPQPQRELFSPAASVWASLEPQATNCTRIFSSARTYRRSKRTATCRVLPEETKHSERVPWASTCTYSVQFNFYKKYMYIAIKCLETQMHFCTLYQLIQFPILSHGISASVKRVPVLVWSDWQCPHDLVSHCHPVPRYRVPRY